MNHRLFVCQTIALFLILVLLLYTQVTYEQGKKISMLGNDVVELDKLHNVDLRVKDSNEDDSGCGGCSPSGEIKTSNTRQETFYFHDFILSYEDCISVKHPCLSHYCPTGMECYMFTPDEFCEGCESEPNCRPKTH